MSEQWHLDPDSYLAMVRSEIPAYDELQRVLADATVEVAAQRVLDLGSGTGETARAVLACHPDAELIGVDGSAAMLAHARVAVPTATFVVGRLEDPLPAGPFDLVVSAFAVHHLRGEAKADLFRRVAALLRPGGRFALCDVVVPEAPVARPVPIEPGVDHPSPLIDQLEWLADAGVDASVVLAVDDLAVIVADLVG